MKISTHRNRVFSSKLGFYARFLYLSSWVLMIGIAVGFTLFFSSCGNDDVDEPPIVDIPLAFLSPMAAGDYTVRITIAAADIPNQIVNEQNLAIVEGSNQTYDVTVTDVPVGNQREIKVEVFNTSNRFVGSSTTNISSGANRLALPLEKVAELLSTEPKAGQQMPGTRLLTLNFSAPPGVVTVHGRQAVVQGHTATWAWPPPGLPAGLTRLNITWTAAGGGNAPLPLQIIGWANTIIINPAAATLTAIGEPLQLSVEVRDRENQPIPNAPVNWSSNAPVVASVNADGLVTARGNGEATITAKSGGASQSVDITVAQASAEININLAAATLTAIEESLQLSAAVRDAENEPILNAPISWSSSNTSVVSVSPRGLVTARGNGKVTITAKSGAKSSTAEITVAQSATTIEITPAGELEIVVGQNWQLNATVRDSNNNPIAGAEVRWESQGPSIATVNSTGLVTAKGNGQTNIIVSSSGLSQLVTINVPDTMGPSIVTGTVSDGDIRVDVGAINAGGFRFDFDEPIIGNIKLTNERGVNLNWTSNVLGKTATLTVVPGKELVGETTYKIEFDVRDGVGNERRQTITFVTAIKH